MEYTKGEWEYTEELGATLSMISGTEEVVCGLPNPIPSDSYDSELTRMRANAHLIAAAPELYEALKTYQLWNEGHPVGSKTLPQIQEMIMDVIAKVEGKYWN